MPYFFNFLFICFIFFVEGDWTELWFQLSLGLKLDTKSGKQVWEFVWSDQQLKWVVSVVGNHMTRGKNDYFGLNILNSFDQLLSDSLIYIRASASSYVFLFGCLLDKALVSAVLVWLKLGPTNGSVWKSSCDQLTTRVFFPVAGNHMTGGKVVRWGVRLRLLIE